MENPLKQKDEQKPKEQFFESVINLCVKSAVYVVVSLIVFIIGNFSWWIGFILFLILAAHMLLMFLVHVFLFFVGMTAAVAYQLLKDSNTEIEGQSYYLFLTNLLNGVFCLFLLVLAYLLGVFFFTN
jgi:hypothetical protein